MTSVTQRAVCEHSLLIMQNMSSIAGVTQMRVLFSL